MRHDVTALGANKESGMRRHGMNQSRIWDVVRVITDRIMRRLRRADRAAEAEIRRNARPIIRREFELMKQIGR